MLIFVKGWLGIKFNLIYLRKHWLVNVSIGTPRGFDLGYPLGG